MKKISKIVCVFIPLACFAIGVHVYINKQFQRAISSHSTNTQITGGQEEGFDDVLKAQMHRKKVLKSVCLKNNLTKFSESIDSLVARQLFVEEKHRFLYCEVPKVGCSNWKRIIFQLKQEMDLDPDILHHDIIHSSGMLKRLSDYPKDQQKKMLDTYTKVMFTRDPLQRLVSCYRDKLLHGEIFYGKKLPSIIIERYRKDKDSKDRVRFKEFIKYVLDGEPWRMDIHWRPMYYLCDPCNINYDVLGKLETIKRDSDYVLNLIDAPPTLKYPTIKQFNESKTDSTITTKYFSGMSLQMLDSLLKMYKFDFSLFDY